MSINIFAKYSSCNSKILLKKLQSNYRTISRSQSIFRPQNNFNISFGEIISKLETRSRSQYSSSRRQVSRYINLFNSNKAIPRISITTNRAMSSSAVDIKASSRIINEEESVWNEFISLALSEKPLNLGQGLPDYPEAAPDHVKENLVKAVSGANFMLNQYTRGYGHPRLVNAISSLYSRLLKKDINPLTEVLVTIGAYESIFCIINAFIDEGDEAIVIEPFFDCYEPMVRLAKGKCKFVPLRLRQNVDNSKSITSADWVLDMTELESNISNKTKLLILNNPHNPVGKVFSKQELEALAEVCQKHNLLVLSDEVYEHLVIDGEHVRIAALPGMWDRTITVGSAGKTFSVTGWKLGWSYGPANLMKYVRLFHQNCIYTCPTPIQEAVAESFEIEISRMGTPESYWSNLASSLRGKRDYMVKFLTEANLNPTIPEGGYFLVANVSNLLKKFDVSQESGKTKDHKLARWLSKHKKFQGIPPSAFYSEDHKNLAEDFIRLCYFKQESTLKQAGELVSKL